MSSLWLRTREPGKNNRFAMRQRTSDHGPKGTWLEKGAYTATIVTGIVASFTLVLGYWQFNETQVLTRQTLALQQEALQHERIRCPVAGESFLSLFQIGPL